LPQGREELSPVSLPIAGYDAREFSGRLKGLHVAPHAARKAERGSGALDARTTRCVSYKLSQRKRKLVEEIFGWVRMIGERRA